MNKRSKYTYKTGTKVIEIEAKGTPEIHTDANFNIKNLGTKPHSKGGTKVVAEEGDVVFPTQNSKPKYKKIITAIQNGDVTTLENERRKLPSDSKYKKAKGDKNIDLRHNPEDFPENRELEFIPDELPPVTNPSLGVPTATELVTQPNTSGGPNTSIVTPNSNVASKYGVMAQNLLDYAPSTYNLITGAFEKPVKTERRFYSPETQQYQDMSQPLRNQSQQAFKTDVANVKSVSGGQASTFLANTQQASNRAFDRSQQIENTEAQRRLQISNTNRDIRNQAKATNLELANQYDNLDLENKAAKRNFLTTGLTQASEISQFKRFNKNLKTADDIRTQTLGAYSSDFELEKDEKGNITGRTKFKTKTYNKGTKSVKGYKMKNKTC